METNYPLSATQVGKLRCKRYFYFEYVDPERELRLALPNAPLERGRDVHSIIEDYQRHLKAE